MSDFSPAPKRSRSSDGSDEGPPDRRLLVAAHRANVDDVVAALNAGANVEAVEAETGLSPIHIAIGTNNLPLTRLLLESWGASIKPDARGRWPSVIAARCRVGGDLCDYVVEAEAKAQAED